MTASLWWKPQGQNWTDTATFVARALFFDLVELRGGHLMRTDDDLHDPGDVWPTLPNYEPGAASGAAATATEPTRERGPARKPNVDLSEDPLDDESEEVLEASDADREWSAEASASESAAEESRDSDASEEESHGERACRSGALASSVETRLSRPKTAFPRRRTRQGRSCQRRNARCTSEMFSGQRTRQCG